MLRQLHIVNLAVIQDVSLELGPGLNCFTGQTGAGKSLILGAFELLLGLKSGGAELVRPDCPDARITGYFEIRDPHIRKLIKTAVDIDVEDELLITRKLFATGRSSVSVNGQPATTAMVKTMGELLVDVHGQHDHQYLLKPSNQLYMLDAYADCESMRDDFAAVHKQWRELRDRRAALMTSSALRDQQLELYEFQADEIDQADPLEGELPELNARHRLLSQLKRVQGEVGQVHAALSEAEGAVLERLQMIAHMMIDLAEIDPQLEPIAQQLREHAMGVQENSYEIERYLQRLDLDPNELEQVEQRLNTLNRLAAKYANRQTAEDPIEIVLALRHELEAKIIELRKDRDDLGGIDEQIVALDAQRKTLAEKLTNARQAAADKIKPLIERELKDLGMTEAKFALAITPQRDAEKIDAAASPTGFDQIEMMVQTNPGQPARPLRKIASGGELSRVMLAMKTILAQADRISVLVFDEIDANVGGRLGTVIGQKLRQLTRPQKGGGNALPPSAKSKRASTTRVHKNQSDHNAHQVLCITHLPQIAAYGDHHVRISKHVTGKGDTRATQTKVTVLDPKTRVDELAEMLAGRQVTATTRKQVLEMLDAAG